MLAIIWLPKCHLQPRCACPALWLLVQGFAVLTALLAPLWLLVQGSAVLTALLYSSVAIGAGLCGLDSSALLLCGSWRRALRSLQLCPAPRWQLSHVHTAEACTKKTLCPLLLCGFVCRARAHHCSPSCPHKAGGHRAEVRCMQGLKNGFKL